VCDHAGQRGNAPGGIAAQGAAGNYWNGPYGYGHYLSRFLLPDNGVTNSDGNHLRGNFYSFQVGTVKFISLDADDVIYQDGGADGLPQAKVISERNAITGSQAVGFTRNAADSIEDAPWSAATNAGDAYGYAVFDVDPGVRPGDTTITMKYFAIPAVSNEAGTAHDVTTTLPTTRSRRSCSAVA
jgi:hypothetical protein